MVQKVFLFFEPHLKDVDNLYAPIFIVGAPRTGSTFLYQLMLKHFRLGFLSNTMALFPIVMSKMAYITQLQLTKKVVVKKSNFGLIDGLHAPNEASKISDLWFADRISSSNIQRVRKSIFKISRYLDRPVLIKSMGNSLRIGNVIKVFPEARFIFVRRNVLYTAQSIILAREKLYNDREQWWSLKPQGYESIRASQDYFYQAIWQICEIEDKIYADLNYHCLPFIQVEYESLCKNQTIILDNIKSEFNLSRICTESRRNSAISSGSKMLNPDEWKRLEMAYKLMQTQANQYH